MKLRTKIMLIALLPVAILGISIYILAVKQTENGIYDEAYEGMQAASLAVRDIFEVGNQGEYHMDKEGNLWKGNTLNISQAVEIVDHIKDNTGMDVTIFWGDERILTSIKNEAGERQINTKASDDVVQKVLKNGEYYLDRSVDILGTSYVVCYAPLYQNGKNSNEPVGMIFVGKPRTGITRNINSFRKNMLLIIIAVLLIAGFIVVLLINRLVQALDKSMGFLQRIADGDLMIEVDETILNRLDEVGMLGREIQELRNKLRAIVDVLRDKSRQLDLDSNTLSTRSDNILEAMKGLDRAAQEMSVSSVSQAEDTNAAGSNVTAMGEMIGDSNTELRTMHDISNQIQDVAEQMMKEIQELNNDMEQVRLSLDYLGKQTSLTKESVDRIGSATELIANVASQTSLLSLNATIEAARAGELGKGFSVVAAEIQKLSVQSNDSVEDIWNVVSNLTENANNTVERMEKVQEVIKNQEKTIEKTGKVFETVKSNIANSVLHMDTILKQSEKMEEKRVDVVTSVQNSAALAQENAANIEEMMASIESVYEEIQVLSDKTLELKGAATQMKESVGMFKYEA